MHMRTVACGAASASCAGLKRHEQRQASRRRSITYTTVTKTSSDARHISMQPREPRQTGLVDTPTALVQEVQNSSCNADKWSYLPKPALGSSTLDPWLGKARSCRRFTVVPGQDPQVSRPQSQDCCTCKTCPAPWLLLLGWQRLQNRAFRCRRRATHRGSLLKPRGEEEGAGFWRCEVS